MTRTPALIAFSVKGVMDGPGITKRLITGVENAMRLPNRSVTSGSGRSAALAINYCERHGWDYTVRFKGGFYFVQGLPLHSRKGYK